VDVTKRVVAAAPAAGYHWIITTVGVSFPSGGGWWWLFGMRWEGNGRAEGGRRINIFEGLT